MFFNTEDLDNSIKKVQSTEKPDEKPDEKSLKSSKSESNTNPQKVPSKRVSKFCKRLEKCKSINTESSYAKKERLQREQKEDIFREKVLDSLKRVENCCENKEIVESVEEDTDTSFYGSLKDKMKKLKDNMKKMGSGFFKKLKNLKGMFSKFKIGGDWLSGKVLAGLFLFYQWWKTASKHKYGVIGWIFQKIQDNKDVILGFINTLWEKIKSGDNFIYKLAWGEDGTGEKSGIIYEVKKFITEDLWNYFASGKAWEHIKIGANFILQILDEFAQGLFGKDWTDTKIWWQEKFNALLDWWDAFSKQPGAWIYRQIYDLFGGKILGFDLPKPSYVTKEEQIIQRAKQDKDEINETISNTYKKYNTEYNTRLNKINQEATFKSIEAEKNNQSFDTAQYVNNWKENNKRIMIEKISVNKLNEFYSNNIPKFKILQMVKKGYNVNKMSVDEFNELYQKEFNSSYNIVKDISQLTKSKSYSKNTDNIYTNTDINTNNTNKTEISIKNTKDIINNIEKSSYSSQNSKSISVKTSKYNAKINKSKTIIEEKNYDKEIIALSESHMVLTKKINSMEQPGVETGLLSSVRKI